MGVSVRMQVAHRVSSWKAARDELARGLTGRGHGALLFSQREAQQLVGHLYLLGRGWQKLAVRHWLLGCLSGGHLKRCTEHLEDLLK